MGIDNLFIELLHNLCERFGFFLTPFLRSITICGEKAWLFLVVALFLVLRKKTRWVGATAILAVFIGFIFADVIMKPFFMRMRPYTESNLFQDYWALAGAYAEEGYSMPSGHTVGVTSFFISLLITCAKKYRPIVKRIGIVAIILMVISRCYFMHHYLTDCMVGIVVGVIASYIAKVIVRLLFNICKRYSNFTIFNFILNFDLFRGFAQND